ncbi:hypothetical protein NDU88_002048 [Pleurodeles waltl]|uniref:Uncharacterized protein n=1 Tax=Pleurodeles waltl TaxID=8319 RepID=A0AAV7M4V9_PLEWA|nr:hypothetical protein NDU88_002048 [Pleurodeles waltl]
MVFRLQVVGYRNTGASVTMVMEKLVTTPSPGGGGVTGPKKVVVPTDLPVECLLGNDLESSAWAEVELEAHAAMPGIPGHIFALTRPQAKKQREQGNLDLGIIYQVLPKTRDKKGKPLSTIPPSTDDSPFVEEEVSPCAEPTPEELESDTAELLGAGGPAREELSVAHQAFPTLEGLRQQAVKQQNGDVNDSHSVYWENNLLYTEARDPKPGATRRLASLFSTGNSS